MTGITVHLLIDLFLALGHKEHGQNLRHAYGEYIQARDRLIFRNCPRFEDKTADIIEDSFKEIEMRYAEYVSAYKEFCKAYQHHIDLITIKPWKEPKNA